MEDNLDNFQKMFSVFEEGADDELKSAKDELLEQGKRLKDSIRVLAEITQDPVMIFKVKEIDLTDKLTEISFNMKNITQEQYKELANMVEQFYTIVDDYIEEKGIVLKGKNND